LNSSSKSHGVWLLNIKSGLEGLPEFVCLLLFFLRWSFLILYPSLFWGFFVVIFCVLPSIELTLIIFFLKFYPSYFLIYKLSIKLSHMCDVAANIPLYQGIYLADMRRQWILIFYQWKAEKGVVTQYFGH
jgi:hypothetical protein